MSEKYSLAGSGAYALIAAIILSLGNYFDIAITENDAAQFAQSFVTIYGLLASIIGTLRRKDLTGGIVRK